MKKREMGLIFSLIVMIPIFSYVMQDGVAVVNNASTYSKESIIIYTDKQEFSTIPLEIIDESEIVVVPDLPDGVRIFNSELEIWGKPIDAMGDRVCMITGDLGSLCWWGGSEEGFQVERKSSELFGGVTNDGGFVSITTGQNHTCAIRQDEVGKKLTCWGSNWYGQSGTGSQLEGDIRSPLSDGVGNWTDVDAGRLHTCAINEGRVYCWGDGSLGQIGSGNFNQQNIPLKTSFLETERFVKIGSGSFHNCALSEKGEVFCWGWNGFGQLGNGGFMDSSSPERVIFPGEKEIEILEVGETHNCAIAYDEEVFCWGGNMAGQISAQTNISYPYPLKSFDGKIGLNGLTLGSGHSCMIMSGISECIGELEFEGSITSEKARSFASGDGFFCYVLLDGVTSCNDDFSTVFPPEVKSVLSPSFVLPGRISGVVLSNQSSEHEVLIGGELDPYAKISFIIQQGKDTDMDGWSNQEEERCEADPFSHYSSPKDTDQDGVCNHIDSDDDNDGFSDDHDSFPEDPEEWRDNDNDGIGSNEDSFEFTIPIYGAIFTLTVLFILAFLEYFDLKTRISSNEREEE